MVSTTISARANALRSRFRRMLVEQAKNGACHYQLEGDAFHVEEETSPLWPRLRFCRPGGMQLDIEQVLWSRPIDERAPEFLEVYPIDIYQVTLHGEQCPDGRTEEMRKVFGPLDDSYILTLTAEGDVDAPCGMSELAYRELDLVLDELVLDEHAAPAEGAEVQEGAQ